MADWNAVGFLGILATCICVLGIGLAVRRFLRRRPRGELLMWGYLVMGIAATHPHHLHRMTLASRSFPGTSDPGRYLPAVIVDFSLMSLGWPFLEYLLLFSPHVNPDEVVRIRSEAVLALLTALVMAPLLTFGLRFWDRRRLRPGDHT